MASIRSSGSTRSLLGLACTHVSDVVGVEYGWELIECGEELVHCAIYFGDTESGCSMMRPVERFFS